MATKVTLTQVAARAGVSAPTASKAFSGHRDVAPQTVDRVRAAAAALGYQPRRPRPVAASTSIWVVIDDVRSRYASLVLHGILTHAQESGAAVCLIPQVDREPHQPGSPAWMSQASRNGAEGFIFVTMPVGAEHVRVGTSLSRPLVALDPASHPPAGVMTVGATNWLGGRQATNHLISLGHSRIAYVGAVPGSLPGDERAAGYRSAMHDAGYPVPDEFVRPGHFAVEDGVAARRLLAGRDRPTAVFAACDEVAVGVLQAARDLDLHVPRDLSVIGFDDTATPHGTTPALTTVRQPLEDMGRLAARTCIDLVRGNDLLSTPVQLATSLVVRESTAHRADP